MAKFLYFIASHTNPEQVIRLAKTIKTGSPDSIVLIHHDYSNSCLNTSAFEQMTSLHVIRDYVPVQWGEFSMVQMELHCINWLITNSIEFDWLIFLSGQDYPIQPLSEVEQFLEQTEYDGFMDYFLAKTPRQHPTPGGLGWASRKLGRQRYFYRYYKLSSSINLKNVHIIRHFFNRFFNQYQPFIKLIFNRSGIHLGIRHFSTPFTPEFQCYAGSQWHTLSYRCVQYVLDFVRQNPEFVKYYRRTIIPDESFFHTILLNNPLLKILNDNKRYISWNGQNPCIWTTKDFERLIASKQHFARKFDLNVDAQLLDLLDRHLFSNQEQITLNRSV